MILKHRYHQYGELTVIVMGKCEDFTHCEINGANKELFVRFMRA